MRKLKKLNNSVLIGILLGDASLIKKYKNGNAYLKYTQSLKNKDYLYYIFNKFKNICNLKKPSYYIYPKSGHSYYTFNTKSIPELTYYHSIFYCENKKILPDNIDNFLTPQAIAH